MRKADEAGFFYLAVNDHVGDSAETRVETMGSIWYEPMATLAWVAAMTQRVRASHR